MLARLRQLRASHILTRSAFGTALVNYFLQRVLRVSGRFPLMVHFTSRVTVPERIEVYGEGVHLERCLALNGGCYLQGTNGLKIHRSVLIAPGVKIISGNHDLDEFSHPATAAQPVHIMEHCWIGANAIILPEVTLLPGTIVGAGSVVVKGFGEGRITVAGNPARIVRERA